MTAVTAGTPQVAPATPTHIKGINSGNARGNYEQMRGHRPDGTSTAARSTGVHTAAHEPIDPASMPNLSPA